MAECGVERRRPGWKSFGVEQEQVMRYWCVVVVCEV